MIHNGIELQGMTHNGVEVQSWIHNGVEIYSAFKPFYWVENNVVTDGYPTDFTVTITQGPGHSGGGTKIATDFGVWSPAQDIGSKARGVATPVQTKGTKYMIMEYYYVGNGNVDGIYINDVFVPNSNSSWDAPNTKSVVVDISEYSSVVLRVDIGAASWGNHFNMKFNRIYFTNEV